VFGQKTNVKKPNGALWTSKVSVRTGLIYPFS
jgi:hypothetical protein